MRLWSGFVVLLALVVVLSTAGCGDDDDSGNGEVLSKQEWVETADAICEGLNNQLAEIPEPQTPEEMTTTGAEVTELTRNTIDELRALVPSPEEEDAVAELLDAFDAVADTGEEFLQAAADGEPPEQLFRDLAEAADTADQLEAAYGLQVCLLTPE